MERKREMVSRLKRIPVPKKLKLFVWWRDRHRCRYCGWRLRWQDITLDHVQPHQHGGDETETNLVLACAACNRHKSSRTPERAGMTLHEPGWRPPVVPRKTRPTEEERRQDQSIVVEIMDAVFADKLPPALPDRLRALPRLPQNADYGTVTDVTTWLNLPITLIQRLTASGDLPSHAFQEGTYYSYAEMKAWIEKLARRKVQTPI